MGQMAQNIQNSNYPIVSSGYSNSKFVQARNLKDESASVESYRSRGRLFRLLSDPLINRLSSPKLVSSVSGGIEKLLLTIPQWVFFADQYPEPDRTVVGQYAEAFKSILGSMENSTEFVVLTNEKFVFKNAENESVVRDAPKVLSQWIKEFKIKNQVTVVEAPSNVRFTVWAEDAYVVCTDEDDNETYFVEPASFNRGDDAIIADLVARDTQLIQSQVSLYFQGGNVLIGDDFWMIGADYPNNSLELGYVVPQDGESERDAVDRAYGESLDQHRLLHIIGSRVPVPAQQIQKTLINGEVWEEVLYFGNKVGTLQPLFHIDMFISMIGRDDSGKFKLLVGDPKLASDLLGEQESSFSMQAVFDDIAKQMEILGFNVERTPLPLVYDDDVANKTRYWYFATSNNAITQDDPKIVWLPTYGHGVWKNLSKTDEANKVIWEQNGYEVRPLANFHPFAANLGAAHCITKYLGRANSLPITS